MTKTKHWSHSDIWCIRNNQQGNMFKIYISEKLEL